MIKFVFETKRPPQVEEELFTLVCKALVLYECQNLSITIFKIDSKTWLDDIRKWWRFPSDPEFFQENRKRRKKRKH